MKTLVLALAAGASLAAAHAHAHAHVHADAHSNPHMKRQLVLQPAGCYTGQLGSFAPQDTYTWQSSAHCAGICQPLGKPVMALSGTNACACGDLLPDPATKVSDAQCDSGCTGYGEPCGGSQGQYTVWLTGIDDAVGSVADDESSSSASPISTTARRSSSQTPTPTSMVISTFTSTVQSTQTQTVSLAPTTIIRGQETIIRTVPVTQTPTAAAGDSSGGKSSGSTIGIAVGVVAGVVALAAVIGLAIFCVRRRRRAQSAENGHARAESLDAFVAQGGTLPGMASRSAAPTLPNLPLPAPAFKRDAADSRLDPSIMVERRQSGGSVFADNEDYSRRILKVANPDRL